MRLEGLFISRHAILTSSRLYEIIKKYLDNKYLPTILSTRNMRVKYCINCFSVDAQADNIRIITAYRPNWEEWEDGFRIRGATYMKCHRCGSNLNASQETSDKKQRTQ